MNEERGHFFTRSDWATPRIFVEAVLAKRGELALTSKWREKWTAVENAPSIQKVAPRTSETTRGTLGNDRSEVSDSTKMIVGWT